MRRLEELLHDLAEQDRRLPTNELITRIERRLSDENDVPVIVEARLEMDTHSNTPRTQRRRWAPAVVAAGAALLVLLAVGLPILFFGGGDSVVVAERDEPANETGTTTTQAPPSTAATATTEPSLAGALEGLAAAKGSVSTTTPEGRPIIPMTLTFDGESCTFDGPTELTPGPVRYTFVNESKAPAVQVFMEVLEGKTLEDMIVNNGPEPFPSNRPSWTRELGAWWITKAGASDSWRKYLKPGNYFMVCASAQPIQGWNGPWLTVAE